MYYSDNSGILYCLDINTMKYLWMKPLDDDTDVTPVISQEEDGVYLYLGTEVDYQQPITGNYLGNAYIYKINALTGKTIWRNSYQCWTKNDQENVGNDINGGVMATPIVGKNKISNLVVFSFCMTNGIYSGNTLAAFDKVNGQLLWDYKSPNYGWSSPVDVYSEDGDAYIIFPDSQSKVHILNGSNGRSLHVGDITMKGDVGGNVESSAAVYNDTLVIGTRRGVIVGLKLK
jgi:outer membrane protein assembly factor BamB